MKTALMSLVALVSITALPGAAQAPGARSPHPEAWTLDEAVERLRLAPSDPYLQYVALQLSRGTARREEVSDLVERSARVWNRDAELMGIFSGALAVQESLQLDAMRAEGRAAAKPGGATVPIASLLGPTIRSHPWKEMLAGREPRLSRLAACVPQDFYLVYFRSLNKLLEAFDAGDLWATHLLDQAELDARTHRVGEHLRTQLAVRTDPLLRPFYDMVVEEVAVTGSDLYLREGSDVTLLFRYRQPQLFEKRMNALLEEAVREHPGARRGAGEVEGVAYEHVASPGGEVRVYSAWPEPGLHLRSNSITALARVLRTMRGAQAGGERASSLAALDEYRYVRTLMPLGAEEEHGFVYLSDAFVRHLVGPRLRLAERRRLLCYNHLRMIGHAELMHRTQHGSAPADLEALHSGDCAPGRFGEEHLVCPDGGRYELRAGVGWCSRHGRIGALVPCTELDIEQVSAVEARLYRDFVTEYSRYWRRYFDPIALRLRLEEKVYRIETLVLPLIDNSIYQGLSMALGGETVELDPLPALDSAIFSLGVHLSEELMSGSGGLLDLFDLEIEEPQALRLRTAVNDLIARGIGRTAGMHLHDADPLFDLNLPQLLGMFTGGIRGDFELDDDVLIAFLIASLNAPVHISIPVRDAGVVDTFLEQLDYLLAAVAREGSTGGFFSIEPDFYRIERAGHPTIRCQSLRLGPIRWRVFWARLGDGFYLASERWLLGQLETAVNGERGADRGPLGHAMLRVRASAWNRILEDYRLGWAENNRLACLANLAPLYGVARALRADDDLGAVAERVLGVRHFCPEGGEYRLAPDGGRMECSIHGSTRLSRQPLAPSAEHALGRLLSELKTVTAAATFEEDGLRAVLTIERR